MEFYELLHAIILKANYKKQRDVFFTFIFNIFIVEI